MAVEPVQRRLAAILAADILGYGRLVREDEEGTLSAVKSDITETFDPNIEAHNGRIFKSMGDGLLVEFASVVDAVRCAVKVQRAMQDRNADRAEDRKIEFRIGINLGDVVAVGDDLHGDGVNIAARLEGLAEPGGIWISGSAFEQVRDKLEVGFEDLGDQQVKNIDRPVRAYRVAPDQARALAGGTADTKAGGAKRWRIPAMAAFALVIIAAGGLAVWRPWAPTVEPASIERMVFPLPDKPSIAVLPFNNMSDDPAQEYFVDGMTEDLITDLSKVSALFVISRNSVFTYKGQPVKVRRVAEELGVRYVLEGSVRRVGDQVRINAQLIDATTGGHLWADRYDGSMANVFEFQDQVTRKIVAALEINLTAREQDTRTRERNENPQAYDAFLQGRELLQQSTPESIAAAVPHLERALELDPEYSRAQGALAAAYWEIWQNNWVKHLDLSFLSASRKAKHHLELALVHPTPLAHQIAAKRAIAQDRHEDAIAESKRAIALDPNDPAGYIALATSMVYAGKAEQAEPAIEKAMRLNPHYGPDYLVLLGQIQFNTGRYEEAMKTFQSAVIRNPGSDAALLYLASALGHLGQKKESEEVIERFNQLRQSQDLSSFNKGIIDHWPVGGTAERDRLGAGLTGVESWRDLLSREEGRYIVKGAILVNLQTAKSLHDRNVVFIDVRTDSQWAREDHIPGAIHLELAKFNRASLSAIVAKDREVVFYCTILEYCLHSAQASAMALSWGFTSVYYFREGMYGWRSAGFSVEIP